MSRGAGSQRNASAHYHMRYQIRGKALETKVQKLKVGVWGCRKGGEGLPWATSDELELERATS